MKTLLLFLVALCVSVGCRHDTTRDYRDLPEEVTLRDWTNLDTVDAAPLTLESLCAYLQEYSDSCFADSTHEPTGFSSVTGPLEDGTYKFERDYYPWTHRTPDLPGFVAFLKRRVKR